MQDLLAICIQICKHSAQLACMPHCINAAPRVYPFNELALLLLVLGIFANDHDAALTLDNLALFADGFNGRSYFHVCCLLTSSIDQFLLRQVIRPRVKS